MSVNVESRTRVTLYVMFRKYVSLSITLPAGITASSPTPLSSSALFSVDDSSFDSATRRKAFITPEPVRNHTGTTNASNHSFSHSPNEEEYKENTREVLPLPLPICICVLPMLTIRELCKTIENEINTSLLRSLAQNKAVAHQLSNGSIRYFLTLTRVVDLFKRGTFRIPQDYVVHDVLKDDEQITAEVIVGGNISVSPTRSSSQDNANLSGIPLRFSSSDPPSSSELTPNLRLSNIQSPPIDLQYSVLSTSRRSPLRTPISSSKVQSYPSSVASASPIQASSINGAGNSEVSHDVPTAITSPQQRSSDQTSHSSDVVIIDAPEMADIPQDKEEEEVASMPTCTVSMTTGTATAASRSETSLPTSPIETGAASSNIVAASSPKPATPRKSSVIEPALHATLANTSNENNALAPMEVDDTAIESDHSAEVTEILPTAKARSRRKSSPTALSPNFLSPISEPLKTKLDALPDDKSKTPSRKRPSRSTVESKPAPVSNDVLGSPRGSTVISTDYTIKSTSSTSIKKERKSQEITLPSLTDKTCALCNKSGGALKKFGDETWYHIVCALWTPEVTFASGDSPMEVVDGIRFARAARKVLKCKFCKSKASTSAPLQCWTPTCRVAYHITCARENEGIEMGEVPMDGELFKAPKLPKGSKGHRPSVLYATYCNRHQYPELIKYEGECAVCQYTNPLTKTRSLLLTCVRCGLKVHASCYGVDADKQHSSDPSAWSCDACADFPQTVYLAPAPPFGKYVESPSTDFIASQVFSQEITDFSSQDSVFPPNGSPSASPQLDKGNDDHKSFMEQESTPATISPQFSPLPNSQLTLVGDVTDDERTTTDDEDRDNFRVTVTQPSVHSTINTTKLANGFDHSVQTNDLNQKEAIHNSNEINLVDEDDEETDESTLTGSALPTVRPYGTVLSERNRAVVPLDSRAIPPHSIRSILAESSGKLAQVHTPNTSNSSPSTPISSNGHHPPSTNTKAPIMDKTLSMKNDTVNSKPASQPTKRLSVASSSLAVFNSSQPRTSASTSTQLKTPAQKSEKTKENTSVPTNSISTSTASKFKFDDSDSESVAEFENNENQSSSFASFGTQFAQLANKLNTNRMVPPNKPRLSLNNGSSKKQKGKKYTSAHAVKTPSKPPSKQSMASKPQIHAPSPAQTPVLSGKRKLVETATRDTLFSPNKIARKS